MFPPLHHTTPPHTHRHDIMLRCDAMCMTCVWCDACERSVCEEEMCAGEGGVGEDGVA